MKMEQVWRIYNLLLLLRSAVTLMSHLCCLSEAM